MIELNKIYNEDCLQGMKKIPDGSIDMILCDLPYGTTACKWDAIIPFKPLWEQYERIIKDNGAIVLTGKQPFTSQLVISNPKLFRYEIIWDKVCASNPMLAKKQPLQKHENIILFYKKQPTYNPQMEIGRVWSRGGYTTSKLIHGENLQKFDERKSDKSELKYPKSIKEFSTANRTIKLLHPTQKPVSLFEYLIKTYTNEGDTVLDNCAGSFTTAVACDNTNRNWICMEKEEEYCNIGLTRINDNRERLSLPLLDRKNRPCVDII